MTVLKTETETETAVFSRNTDRNRPSSDNPEPLQHYKTLTILMAIFHANLGELVASSVDGQVELP